MGSRSTVRRAVAKRTSSGTTGTTSSCCSGSTSRNHPRHPANKKSAPRQLTDALVTRPANSRATPIARMNGHAVDAGTSMSRGVCGLAFNSPVADCVGIYPSASENVHYGEDHNPYGIHEVPIHREHFNVTGVFHFHTATKCQRGDDREHDQTCRDVKPVQSDKRVISGSKEVGGDCQSVFVDQPVPFLRCAVKKRPTQSYRDQPQSKECECNAARQKLRRQMNRQTARQ